MHVKVWVRYVLYGAIPVEVDEPTWRAVRDAIDDGKVTDRQLLSGIQTYEDCIEGDSIEIEAIESLPEEKGYHLYWEAKQ
jgi:hypothetical protein